MAGTYESPGDIKEDKDGFLYKENYGMASARAVKFRTTGIDPFEQAKKSFFQEDLNFPDLFTPRSRKRGCDPREFHHGCTIRLHLYRR